MRIAVLGFILLVANAEATATDNSCDTVDVAPFYTDGCSWFPDGDIDQPDQWFHCCYQHDKKYFVGGTAPARHKADREFYRCVLGVTDSPILAEQMYLGVRVGGSPYANSDFRWGYGWHYGRGYDILSQTEKTCAQARIDAFSCREELTALGVKSADLDRSCGPSR